MAKILIVEDEKNMREIIADYMRRGGHSCFTAEDGVEALMVLKNGPVDLMILDIMMPHLDGFSVCRAARQMSSLPIILLTAKSSEEDKLKGYELGADDYITKPFSVVEVLARIKAALRRALQYDTAVNSEPAILTAGELSLNLSDYTLTKRGQAIDLTAKEFEILKLFLQNPKRVYTKEQIYSLVWNDAYLGDENAVNVHISRLRNKIEDDPRTPACILTVWGIGYKLGELS